MLKTNRSRTIGVVIPDITDPVFPPIIRGIEDGLARHGYVAILANTDGNPRRQVQVIEAMRPRGIDGLIVASVSRHDADVSRLTAGMAVVTVSRRTDDPRFSSVVHDEDDGIRRVLTHLASLGHRRIAAIAGPQTVSTGYNRYSSYTRHSKDLGLGLDEPASVIRTRIQRNGGRTLRRRAAGYRATRSRAVVCANDRLAVGAITALRRHGIDCPRDVSITGFNDMALVDRLSPALTTIRVHHYKAGVEAAELIVDTVAGRAAEPRHVVLPVELIVRDSARSVVRDMSEAVASPLKTRKQLP